MRLIVALVAVSFALPITASNGSVLVYVSGIDGRASSISEFPKEIAARDAVWTWTDVCAPVRLTAAAPAPCAEGTATTIRIVRQTRKPVAGTEVRWGTEAMLRELPDALLPVAKADASGVAVISVPKEERVFARVAGPMLASKWTAVDGQNMAIAASEGLPISWQIKTEGGKSATGATVELRPADATHGKEWPFRGAGECTVNIPAVPADAFVHALLLSDDGAPAVVTGRASKLPNAYELPHGVTLRGTVVDSDAKPISNAAVSTMFLVGTQALKVRKALQTGSDGVFGIRGVPAGDVQWAIEKPALARVAQVLKLATDHDLGRIALYPERQLAVEVRDARGNPIKGASLSTTDGAEAKTDARGAAKLLSVPADMFKLKVAAKGFLQRDVTVQEDAKQPFVLVLRDAAVVRAKVVRAADEAPAGPGSVAIEVGGRKSLAEFDDGQLEIDLRDGGVMSLEIRAAGLAPFRIADREVRAGEQVDLGTIKLSEGLAIFGRAVDAESLAPVSGVTMYALRPSDFGPMLSYARRDWVTAQTGADGTFRIDGLAPGVYTLWSEATGRAPMVKTGLVIASDLPDGGLAMGDVPIHAGRTLMLSCTPVARCGAEASVSIAGADWLPLSGAITQGRATVAPLPPGPAVLRLIDRGSLIHERDITISETEPNTELDLRLPSVTVRGSITRARKPVSGGSVTFEAVTSTTGRFVQMAHMSNSGSLGNRFIGSVARRVAANVTDEGTFLIEDLGPGDYRAVWTSAAGVASGEQRITIPDATDFPLRLEIPSARLEGKVVTNDGQPSPRTLVTVEAGGTRAQAFASADGSFVFDGLPPGLAFVQASAVDQRRSETSVEIMDDETERVDLTLEPRSEALTIDVRAAGMPLPNVHVFLRQRGVIRTATTSGEGQARIVPPTKSGPIEIAVHAPSHGWMFIPAQSSETSAPIRIDIAAPSTRLVLRKEKGSAPVSLFANTGFPIHEALTMLGVRPTVYAGMPFQLDGLPSGMYSIAVGGEQKQVAIAREPRVVDF